MERARMLGMEEVVAGGTEGGRSPTGVTPATAAFAATGGPATGRNVSMGLRQLRYEISVAR